MEFKCKVLTNMGGAEEWTGRVIDFKEYDSSYEFWIISRSSIMVIVGRTSRGGFACMPDFRVGCHLVSLKDRFWNTEQLVEILGKVDGTTVADALFSLPSKIKLL